MVRLAVAAPGANATVTSGGCQAVAVCAVPSNAVQLAGAAAAPQVQPHIGTLLPSGSVAV